MAELVLWGTSLKRRLAGAQPAKKGTNAPAVGRVANHAFCELLDFDKPAHFARDCRKASPENPGVNLRLRPQGPESHRRNIVSSSVRVSSRAQASKVGAFFFMFFRTRRGRQRHDPPSPVPFEGTVASPDAMTVPAWQRQTMNGIASLHAEGVAVDRAGTWCSADLSAPGAVQCTVCPVRAVLNSRPGLIQRLCRDASRAGYPRVFLVFPSCSQWRARIMFGWQTAVWCQ